MTTSDRTRNQWKSNFRSCSKSFCRSDATVATQIQSRKKLKAKTGAIQLSRDVAPSGDFLEDADEDTVSVAVENLIQKLRFLGMVQFKYR